MVASGVGVTSGVTSGVGVTDGVAVGVGVAETDAVADGVGVTIAAHPLLTMIFESRVTAPVRASKEP